MMNNDIAVEDRAELVWKALADRTRRKILDTLAERPHTTGELVAQFDALCRTGVMKHLDVLERADLVSTTRDGRTRWNHLNPVPIQQVCDRWVGRHVQHLASAMSRLKAVAEGPPPLRMVAPRRDGNDDEGDVGT